jgi:hypothetical protein
MHGWRHFFNTTLLMANISDDKVMAITGHATQKMKLHYSHLDTIRMADVVEVQSKLFLPGPGKETVPPIEQKPENAEPIRAAEKKQRGRPRKADPVLSVEKKPRGRPRKQVMTQPVEKKPRGRPRKAVNS